MNKLLKELPLPPLVIDPDMAFIDAIKTEAKSGGPDPLTATSEAAALELIQGDKLFSCVFVNSKAAVPLGLPIIKACTLHRPTTPIFLLLDDRKLQAPHQITARHILHKPSTYAELLKAAALLELDFDSEKAIEIASENVDKLDQEVSADDDNYRPIKAATFIAGKSSYFDLYIKIRSGKYVKILQADDVFSPERLKSYITKGVDHFYIRLEAQEHYLRYCDLLTDIMLKTTSATQEMRIAHTLNHGQEILGYLRNNGVNEKLLQYSERFAQNLSTLVEQINFPENLMLTKFLADLTAHEHGISTSLLAAMLAKNLDIEADKSVHLVGLASLFHDIGLLEMEEKFRNEDETLLSPEELAKYYQHPARSVTMLTATKGLDTGVLQAIEQHHERRNRSGFPARLGSNQINRIAEIIGISEEFLRLVERVKTGELKRHPIVEMEISIFDGFSTPVVNAFKTIFDPAKKLKKSKK